MLVVSDDRLELGSRVGSVVRGRSGRRRGHLRFAWRRRRSGWRTSARPRAPLSPKLATAVEENPPGGRTRCGMAKNGVFLNQRSRRSRRTSDPRRSPYPDEHPRVGQGRDFDHRRDGADLLENLAVGAAHLLPPCDVGDAVSTPRSACRPAAARSGGGHAQSRFCSIAGPVAAGGRSARLIRQRPRAARSWLYADRRRPVSILGAALSSWPPEA